MVNLEEIVRYVISDDHQHCFKGCNSHVPGSYVFIGVALHYPPRYFNCPEGHHYCLHDVLVLLETWTEPIRNMITVEIS